MPHTDAAQGTNPNRITGLLQAAGSGDEGSRDDLAEAVYLQLKNLATNKLRREPANQTMQATALVHEAWMRLFPSTQQAFEGRRHFFGAAARAMRQILIEQARARQSLKRSAQKGGQCLDITAMIDEVPVATEELLAVHEAFDELAAQFPRKASVVELRYFCGLTEPETAEVLEASLATVARDWAFARAWLSRRLQRESEEQS